MNVRREERQDKTRQGKATDMIQRYNCLYKMNSKRQDVTRSMTYAAALFMITRLPCFSSSRCFGSVAVLRSRVTVVKVQSSGSTNFCRTLLGLAAPWDSYSEVVDAVEGDELVPAMMMCRRWGSLGEMWRGLCWY